MKLIYFEKSSSLKKFLVLKKRLYQETFNLRDNIRFINKSNLYKVFVTNNL